MSFEDIKSHTNLNSAEENAVRTSVLVPTATSTNLEGKLERVRGPDFESGLDLDALIRGYRRLGFQASVLGDAIDMVNRMINWRLSDEPIPEDESDHYKDPEVRAKTRCTIFLGYTSNMVSSGMREIIKYLVKNKMVDVVVATAGGIEEDLIKCLAPTYLASFELDGAGLRKQGLNRIGNLIVPNDNYCHFEDWIMPLLDSMLEQQKQGTLWTPSKVIHELGRAIDNEDSIYYWAYKNNIPVFCPALTDGSIGDMLYMHSFKHEQSLIIDIVQDIRAINHKAVWSKKTGAIILGGGVVKHHIMNANLMRSGADFAVYINTGESYDGSDSGATPDEAVSWGKIRMGAKPVKVHSEATLVFPLLVAATFAKHFVPKD